MKVMHKYDKCCEVTTQYVWNILLESSKQRLNHLHPGFFHSSFLSSLLSLSPNVLFYLHSTRCIEPVYNVSDIVLLTANPEIQRLVHHYLCFVESSVSLETQLCKQLLYSETGVCARYPEEGQPCVEQGEVSGFNLGKQSYEIQSKFINISLISSANPYRTRYCIRYWGFGHEKSTVEASRSL